MATSPQEQFKGRMLSVIQRIHDADSFLEVYPTIETELLDLLGAERMTVYQKGRADQEIVSRYKTGNDTKEIRVALSTSSIAGYVALTQGPLKIADVYDQGELHKIHENLTFDRSFDEKSGFRSKSMIVVPIKYKEILLGVLQILNRKDGTEFTDISVKNAEGLAKVIGQKFRYELNSTNSPYDYLVQTQRISKRELVDFTERANKSGASLRELLLTEAKISKSELGMSLERYYQVPFMSYDASIDIPRELLKGINESYLRTQLWVPVSGNKEEVVVLIDDPSDAKRIMEVQQTLNAKKYSFRVGLREDILAYLGQGSTSQPEGADLSELVGRLQDEAADLVVDEITDQVDENAATVIQLVNRLIISAKEAGASDIHIEPGKGREPAVVRIRVDGACRSSLSIPSTHIRAVISRIKIMAGLDISERRKPQDGKAITRYKGQPLELRVATIPTVNGESTVLRVLSSGEPIPLEMLNLSENNHKKLLDLTGSPHGIMLVVGPTGSGKTTTLHAVLGHLNTPDKKIWTAEDPVEISQIGLQQVQVNPKVGFDFASALRAFLRADPDIIMIGEMRDRETSHMGVEASLTGHLVLSTLHTNSAAETVTRLLDLGLDPVSFSDALLGVLAQRLVRTLCKNCKSPYKASDDEFETLRRYYGEELFSELGVKKGDLTLHRANGCDDCGGTGYKGRTGIHELLVNSEEIKELIYKKSGALEIKEVGIRAGMRTLMQDGIFKLIKGQTDIDQVRKVAA